MKKFYGVYTQYDPTYKYDEELVSIWTYREDAIKAAEKIGQRKYMADYVWIQPVTIDADFMGPALTEYDENDHIIIKPKVKK